MKWQITTRFDPRACLLADRHYSRQKPGTPQFVKPGRCIVLLTPKADALWVSSWQSFVKHKWPGAWECALFRNESQHLASELILEAVAITRWIWGTPPASGMISFVDPKKIRNKDNPGYCFKMAGFELVGTSKDGKLCFQLKPDHMPEARKMMVCS